MTFEVFNFFPTPLFYNNIDIDIDTKKFLLNSSFKRTGGGTSNWTKSNYILDDEVCKGFVDKLFFQLKLFVNNYLHTDDRHFEWYITNSWVLKHEPNDYNPAHAHANSLITGVYYLEVPEHSGDITFHKPDGLTNIFHVSTNIPYKEYTPTNCGRWTFTPREGDILLFPSHLYHSVGVNETNKQRYSLSINFHIKGTLGTEDDCLNLMGR